MSEILSIHGRQILDSRGNPTVEVEAILDSGASGRAAVPSGASTGAFEAVELRDGDPTRWGGKGVEQAGAQVNLTIGAALQGVGAPGQRALDGGNVEVGGRPDKGNPGADAILGGLPPGGKGAAGGA